MTLMLSGGGQVLGGTDGTRLLATIRESLEQPLRLLL